MLVCYNILVLSTHYCFIQYFILTHLHFQLLRWEQFLILKEWFLIYQ